MNQNHTHQIQESADAKSFSRKILATGLTLLAATIATHAGQGPQPNICTRSCWGASASSCPTQMSSLTRAIIHHTAGAEFNTTGLESSKSYMRSIQNYHKDKGWCDIAYHFLVDKYGNIFEGRVGSMNSLVQGNHAGCGLVNSFGFTFLGWFHPDGPGGGNQPPTAMRNAMYDVIAWRMPSSWNAYGGRTSYPGSLYGTAANIDTHRWVGVKVNGNCGGTACPGDFVNQYITDNFNGGEMRNGVHARKNPAPVLQNRIDLVVRGGGNETYHKFYQSDEGWSSYSPIGGISTGDPTILMRQPGVVDAFVRGTDNGLYHNWTSSGNWLMSGNWENLGGSLTSGPDAVSWDSDRIDIVVRGGGNQIYHKWHVAGFGWAPVGSFELIPGTANAASDPTICSWAPGRLDVFWRGSGNTLKHVIQTGASGWSVVEDLGGSFIGSPDAVCWGSGRIDVVVRDSNNRILHKFYASGYGWSGWEDLGGSATSDPTICSWGPLRLDVFWRGTDNTLRHKFQPDGLTWSLEENLGGYLTSGPDAVAGKW